MSPTAIDEAIDTINSVAEEGELAAETEQLARLDAPLQELVLPDGRVLYPPRLHGEPLHEVACSMIDTEDPTKSRFPRLIGPPGTGKSQIARAIAYELWRKRKRKVIERHGAPFYGLIELQPGPSADEFFFRYDYVPDPEDATRVKLVEAAFAEAMRNGWLVCIDEVNAARDVALLSINGTIDGRLILYLPATGETITAQPGFGVILTYNPGLVGASDIPNAWYSRFPATIEIASNWPALRALGARPALVDAAEKYDEKRKSGELAWTPQFREIESLEWMCERVGERAALSMFVSGLAEQVETGKLPIEEATAACHMLDEVTDFRRYRVSTDSPVANFANYPRAVTR
jgi:hypothetical protein